MGTSDSALTACPQRWLLVWLAGTSATCRSSSRVHRTMACTLRRWREIQAWQVLMLIALAGAAVDPACAPARLLDQAAAVRWVTGTSRASTLRSSSWRRRCTRCDRLSGACLGCVLFNGSHSGQPVREFASNVRATRSRQWWTRPAGERQCPATTHDPTGTILRCSCTSWTGSRPGLSRTPSGVREPGRQRSSFELTFRSRRSSSVCGHVSRTPVTASAGGPTRRAELLADVPTRSDSCREACTQGGRGRTN